MGKRSLHGTPIDEYPKACVFPDPSPAHPEELCCRPGKLNEKAGEPRCQLHWHSVWSGFSKVVEDD